VKYENLFEKSYSLSTGFLLLLACGIERYPMQLEEPECAGQ
jgi:hypothetical protein